LDVFNLFSASAIQLSKIMASCGPAESEGNLTTSPGSNEANREATPVLPCAASTSSHPRSEGVPLAQGNELPSQGYGTSAQGHGPPGSEGQSCPPAQGDGLSHSSLGNGCSPTQGNGCISEDSASSENIESKNEQSTYQIGNVLIVLNTILCFVATKKAWARLLLCDQIKKLFGPEEIEKAHDIVTNLSDSRKPRNTTRDTKKMINIIVHTMIDHCVNRENLVFATTTNIPTTDWTPLKKTGIFYSFC